MSVPAPWGMRLLEFIAIGLAVLGVIAVFGAIVALFSGDVGWGDIPWVLVLALIGGVGVVAGLSLYVLSRRRRCPMCKARVHVGWYSCRQCGTPLVFPPTWAGLTGVLELMFNNCPSGGGVILAVPLAIILLLALVLT